MYLLSKLDTSQLPFHPTQENIDTVNLSLDGSNKPIQLSKLGESNYSNSIRLYNNDYVTYHFTNDFTVLTLYSLNSTLGNRTINIQLPSPTIHEHYTTTFTVIDGKLNIDLILTDSVFIRIMLPLEFILSNTNKLPEDWYSVLHPYDFTVRVPNLLFRVSADFSVTLLEDGGLLGLKNINDGELEPILFSDNSYLQSITKIFSRNKKQTNSKVVSCISFQEKYLIVLTENCTLKIWNLTSFTVINEYDLAQQNNLDRNGGVFDCTGNYLNLFEDMLAIYLPFSNGIFEIGRISMDHENSLCYRTKNTFSSNLPSSSLWSLIDMKLVRPLDLKLPESYINILVLWKSGSISKLQVLNILTDSLKSYAWIEASNRALGDVRIENELDNSNLERTMRKFVSHYPPQIIDEAHRILNENNITLPEREALNEDYIANLDTLLKDIKIKCDEASSLTIYNDEIIIVNSLQKYNCCIYKMNSPLERIYYNINNDSINDDLSRYLKTVYGFSSTLTQRTQNKVSESFVAIVTKEVSKTMTPNEKFTDIFKSHLQSHLEISNINTLFNELNSFDVISLLDYFIDNHLNVLTASSDNFVSSITPDSCTNVIVLKSLYSSILIQYNFVLQILLTFTLLDFEYSIFKKQLDTLLNLHYKQSLFITLYELDKLKVAEELFKQTTKYGQGIQLNFNSELSDYLNYSVCKLFSFETASDPLFQRFFNDLIVDDMGSSVIQQNDFLHSVSWPFYMRDDETHEFNMAMTLLKCNKFDQSYEFFKLHDYVEIVGNSLPINLEEISNTENNNIWRPLLLSFKSTHKESLFFYELSILYSKRNDAKHALKAIRESLDYSLKNVQSEEPQEFKASQLKQYLEFLNHFNKFSEALDVLRYSHAILSGDVRYIYFQALLSRNSPTQNFFSTLLKLCYSHDGKDLYLNPADFEIIDSILFRSLHISDWMSYKKLFSFRMLNKNERKAAEIIYEYSIQVGNDIAAKKRCYLIVMNVLESFDEERDQWILHNSNIITLSSLREELAKL